MEPRPPSDAEVVRRLAAEHLPESDLEQWLALLRPAVQLVPLSDDGVPVARFGGPPSLPEGADWPEWPGHGPLSYIGELRCDRLAAFPLDVRVPSDGRLLFFYFDGSYDDGAATVGTWDASTLQGARVVHVTDGTPSAPRPAPEGIAVYPEREYGGRAIVTHPGLEHPDLEAAFRPPGQDEDWFDDHPVNADDFTEALHERHTAPLHQVGGYADPVQGPVEHEVALAALDNEVPHGDPRLDEEARRWELLLQVDTDDDLGMEWGDAGVLYWMTRADDHGDDVPLGDVSFTWQCG